MMEKEGSDEGRSIGRWVEGCGEGVVVEVGKGMGILVTNAMRPCNIVTCFNRSDFDFLEIAGNVQKFIDLYGKSAKNCQKSSYDNWLLSYDYIIM